jgi:hypothetical protein
MVIESVQVQLEEVCRMRCIATNSTPTPSLNSVGVDAKQGGNGPGLDEYAKGEFNVSEGNAVYHGKRVLAKEAMSYLRHGSLPLVAVNNVASNRGQKNEQEVCQFSRSCLHSNCAQKHHVAGNSRVTGTYFGAVI